MWAQSLELIKSVPLESEVLHASLDRQGNIYIADANGSIERFDREGQSAFTFSADKNGTVTLLEAWQGLRTFVFYRDFQEYLFLNRFLDGPGRFRIGQDLSNYFQWATLAADNNLWLIDQQELSLKKLVIDLNEFIIETPFNLNLDPRNFELTFIREYQNLLFISDRASGVLVFDNLGNYLETLPLKNLSHFSFSDNELMGISTAGTLTFLDIYSQKNERSDWLTPRINLPSWG